MGAVAVVALLQWLSLLALAVRQVTRHMVVVAVLERRQLALAAQAVVKVRVRVAVQAALVRTQPQIPAVVAAAAAQPKAVAQVPPVTPSSPSTLKPTRPRIPSRQRTGRFITTRWLGAAAGAGEPISPLSVVGVAAVAAWSTAVSPATVATSRSRLAQVEPVGLPVSPGLLVSILRLPEGASQERSRPVRAVVVVGPRQARTAMALVLV
jgi:hypothetical protein